MKLPSLWERDKKIKIKSRVKFMANDTSIRLLAHPSHLEPN